MSALIVDTSAWISYFRGQENTRIERALADGMVYLPSIVVSELMSGRLTKRRKEELLSFLGELPLVEASFAHWVRVGELRSRSLVAGLSISTPDAHIAQSAIDMNAELLSEDEIFKKISKKEPLRLAS